MMIRINLLPVRQVKKRAAGRQMLFVIGGVLVATVALNFLWWSGLSSQHSKNASRIAQTQAQVKELEKVIGEVNNISKRKKEIEEKLAVLEQLRRSRSGPVRMLDALATATPKKVWLKEFDEKANVVKLTGTAISHEDVAEFMRSLGNLVWTPKGMGRLVEQKRDAKTARVELLDGPGAIEDFPVAQIKPFFTGIDLKKAEQKEVKDGRITSNAVDFEIGMTAQYAL